MAQMTAAQLAVQNALAAARTADPSKAQSTRDPFIPPGTHELVLTEISPDLSPDERGRPQCKVWVRFLCEETTQPELQTPIILSKMFDLQRRPQYESQSSDADAFMLLLMVATGLPNGPKLLELFEDVIDRRVEDQLLRGRIVRAVASFGKQKKGVEYRADNHGHQLYEEGGKEKQRWVNVDFVAVSQSREDTAKAREYLDQDWPIRERRREAGPRDDDEHDGSAHPNAPRRGYGRGQEEARARSTYGQERVEEERGTPRATGPAPGGRLAALRGRAAQAAEKVADKPAYEDDIPF